MIRIMLSLLVCVCVFTQVADAQVLRGADGCTVDAEGRKLSCPLARRAAPSPAAVLETFEPVPQPAYVVSSYAVQSAPVAVRSGGSSRGSAASYGSSGGGFAVGQRDSQGYVITSIGSTVSPTIAAAGTQSIQPLAIGDRIAFRRALLEAARQARKSGDITAVEFFVLSAASRNPSALDKMQQAVHEAAIEDGLATTQAIDWNNLIDFIEKLIPIIIKLIDLFS